jgi:hypothetical protein
MVQLLEERRELATKDLRECPKEEIDRPRAALSNIESLLNMPEVLVQELKEKDNAGRS